MANRHLARSVALQTLFEWDFRSLPNDALDTVEEILDRNIEEFAPGIDEVQFIKDLTKGILSRLEQLDLIIAKAARDWPLDQTPVVDRNCLRLGLYELLFSKKDEVPARVAINEAIEIAKTFGGEKSGKFINGVLGTIYKEMGEPGKDDEPKKKKKKLKKKSDLTKEEIAKLPVKRLVGTVVYHVDESSGEPLFGFVHDVFGHWTLSKGGIKPEDELEPGLIREIKDEMNLDIEPMDKLGENEYIATDPEIGHMRKQVIYFLSKAKNPGEIKVNPESGGLSDAKWFPENDFDALKLYPDIKPLLDKGVAIVKKSL